MPTVLITGCDTGLGREFARQYAAEGHRVIATFLDLANAREGADLVGNVEKLQLDVTDHVAVSELATSLSDAPIDILVSNAGIGHPHKPFGQTDFPFWRRVLETNLIGPMKIAECFADHVARSDLRMMAFVSSRMGSINLNVSGGAYAYRTSKAGLNMMVRSLAIDLLPRKVCVLALHPGWAATEPGGRVPVEESVAGMRGVLHRAGPHHTGSFVTYNDQPLSW